MVAELSILFSDMPPRRPSPFFHFIFETDYILSNVIKTFKVLLLLRRIIFIIDATCSLILIVYYF